MEKNVSFFLYACIILYSLFPPLSALNELKNKSKKLTPHKDIWSLLNLLSASELVWKGQHGILLEIFCLQGWVCGKWRPQGGGMVWERMKWEFRATACFLQREEQPRNPPPTLGQSPFLVCVGTAWGFILLFTLRNKEPGVRGCAFFWLCYSQWL